MGGSKGRSEEGWDVTRERGREREREREDVVDMRIKQVASIKSLGPPNWMVDG